MSFWKKEKNKEIEVSATLSQALHTMKDDMEGRAPAQSTPPLSRGNHAFQGNDSHDTAVEAEAGQESRGEAPANLPISPFLDGKESPHEETPSFTPSPKPTAVETAPQEVKAPAQSTSTSSSSLKGLFENKKALLFASLGLLILIGAGIGGYMFFFSSGSPTPEAAESIENLKNTTEMEETANTPAPPQAPSAPIAPAAPRFSVATPNLLSLNTETVTAGSLRTLLLQTAQQVKDENLPGAVEFLIRDQNYNPLAFSRFAYLAEMNFSQGLLAQLDEDFSLFVYVDQGRPHLGLLTKVKNLPAFQTELGKAEKDLPQALSLLFVDTTTAPKTGLTFKSGSYGAVATRYTNVDAAINLSLDYALKDNNWVVGTSRDTLRSMLDRNGAVTPPSAAAIENTTRMPGQ